MIATVAIACGIKDTATASSSDVRLTRQLKYSLDPNNIHLIQGPISLDGIQATLATPDLGVGTHRIAFVIQSEHKLIQTPSASVVSRFFPETDSAGQLHETALAVFRPWQYGIKGTYTTQLTFNSAGRWSIDITTLLQNGPSLSTQVFFEVSESTKAPDIGSSAIPSMSKTLSDVEGIGQLTTGSIHDPDLYQITIRDALSTGVPTVVVMVSPAFCTNAVCGPQLEILRLLKEKYKGRANFIHVDLYDNPDEIYGDLDRARLSPTISEWNLPSTEWTFVIDGRGDIVARFESFATFDEIEQVLLRALRLGS